METNKPTKECKTCKSKNPLTKPNGMMLIGAYILISSAYGTIEIIKNIFSLLFK